MISIVAASHRRRQLLPETWTDQSGAMAINLYSCYIHVFIMVVKTELVRFVLEQLSGPLSSFLNSGSINFSIKQVVWNEIAFLQSRLATVRLRLRRLRRFVSLITLVY